MSSSAPYPLPTDGSLRPAEQAPALPGVRGKTLVGGGVLVVLVIALPPIPAVAATSVTAFGVSAVVLPSPSTCLIEPAGRASDIHRGALPRIVSAILVRCTGTLPYQVSLAVEGAANAIEASLRMTDRLAASWSYAPFQNIVHLIRRSDTGRRDHRVANDGPAGPTAITYDRSVSVMPVADVDTVTITVRY